MTTDTGLTEAPYAWLQDRYPVAFPLEHARIRPLKVGIYLDLLAANLEMKPQTVKKMLAIWCGRPTYQKALMRGGPRVDLHGEPVGEVTPEQMARAAERLKAIAEKKKRKVQPTPAKPPEPSLPPPAQGPT